ncbi:hypothetical protein [Streptomyces sp. NPDC059909]|uniref:hypothetical protein n=1 Tax=Streptomyces sp. NPDC059909 TaxID=3346998 RepID=UPI00364AE8B6
MEADRHISVGGLRDKPIHWKCPDDAIEAEAVHPVQMVHLRLGQEEVHAGRLTRIVALDMVGAELMVYREAVAPARPVGGERRGEP